MKFKLGEKVKCVDGELMADHITEGRVYKILAIRNSPLRENKPQIMFIDDNGGKCWAFDDRFVSITESDDGRQQDA